MGTWPGSSSDVNATSKIELGRKAAQLGLPAVAIPTNRSSADVEKHGKSRMDAADEIESPWSTSSGTSFTNFFKYLQTDRPRTAEGEEENLLHNARCSFCVTDVVRFLEESNAHIVSKASQELADMTASYESEMAILKRDHGERVELFSSLKKVSRDLSDASAEVTRTEGSVTAVVSELQDRVKAAQLMQAQSNALIKNLETRLKDLNAKMEGLEGKLRHVHDAAQAKDREMHRLEDGILEMERTIAKMLQVSLSESLKRELALFVQSLWLNSLESECNTANDHDNVALLKDACHSVDRATDRLAKYLNKYVALASDLELPIRFIGSRDFLSPDKMKHIWGHWICEQMFQGFEHAFFEPGQEPASPLDFQKLRVKCFQIFQEKNRVPSLLYYMECDLFRRFCARMFSLVFPPHLIEDVRFRHVKMLSQLGDDGEESKLDLNFLDLAKAVYLLHKLSFCFDPPARILRMGNGEPYDKRYHDSVVTGAGSDITPATVVLLLRPGFQVKSTVIKCRVFLKKACSGLVFA